MVEFKSIETPRLKIIPFQEHMITDQYLGWLNDPTVVRYSELRHRKQTRDACQAYLASFRNTDSLFLAIQMKAKNLQHIGNISVYVDRHDSIAELAILIGEKNAWGKGYGTEAWKACCDYLLNVYATRKISAGTLSVNFGMRKIMERSGMIADGRRVRHVLFEGNAVDIIHAALFNTK